MKWNIKRNVINISIGLLCVLGITTLAASTPNEAAYFQRYKVIMETMKNEMKSTPLAGDPALNYLYQMIPHHESATKMAEGVLAYGTNRQVKQIAKNTVKKQKKEIDKMRKLINKLKKIATMDKEREAAYMKEYEEFLNEMTAKMEAVRPTGNVDEDFLLQMIPHHRGAINISCAVLKYTSHGEVREMAEKTIKEQAADIEKMSKILSEVN